MDFVELLRRRDVIQEASRWFGTSAGFPASIDIRTRQNAEDEPTVAHFTVVPSLADTWNVLTPHERTDRYVELGGVTEAEAAAFIWNLIAENYCRRWVLTYPAYDKKSALTLQRTMRGRARMTRESFLRVIGVRALDPETPEDRLVALSAHADVFVRECVATNERTPTDTLRSLAVDREASVVMSVARNHATPTDVVDALSSHDDLAVRWTAAGNPSLSPQRCAELVAVADFGTRWYLAAGQPVPIESLLDWCGDEVWMAHRLLQRNDATPEAIAATFDLWSGAHGTFGPTGVHPATPTSVLDTLLALNSVSLAEVVLFSSRSTSERIAWLLDHRDSWIDQLLLQAMGTERAKRTPLTPRAAVALAADGDPRARQLFDVLSP